MTTVERPSASALNEAVKSKVILITGSASGIGLASARLLAKHGAQLVIVDIDATKCRAATESIGNGAVWKTCDVSDWYQQVDLFQWIVSQFGALDVVMCNAGIDPELASSLPDGHPSREKARGKVFYDFSQDEMEEGPGGKGHVLKAPSTTILDVNVKGPLYNLKLAMHHMKALGKGGRIVFVGSANSYLPIPDQMIYVTSKHAVLGMMRAASRRQDCKDAGITICLLAPWTTVTPLTAEILETIPDEQIEKSSPDDLAWAVGYMCSADAQLINSKGFWVQGSQIKEVEGEFHKLTVGMSSSQGNDWML
ncbi:hypothetical protein LTS18_006435 [Coniosporium uncinatum]|uniref:Uncharacterized protein n=1 Tax=Coniosporium uncinatum TaxID=93489 RepID=A0ACC3D3S6_9PEZI|nr:hypothetical protein LTS18_006435 [Coniosporium uncinatum]